MQTYRIPQTDLDVSRLALGTWHLGGNWDDQPAGDDIRARAVQLISASVDHGINHIDLADIYTRGKSDAMVGYALAQNPNLRDRLILQGKAGIILADTPNTGDPARYDFSYQHLVSAVEGTLSRLGTDRLDLLAFHRPDPLAEPAEVARAVDDLYASGKVRYFGVSNHSWSQIELLQKHLNRKLVVNQMELSLLHPFLISEGILTNNSRTPFSATTGTLDYCRSREIMIQAWSPVAGGRLFHADSDSPANQQTVMAEIASIATELQTTPEAIALAWLLRHPAKIQPIIGTLNPARIAPSAAADEIELSRIHWYRLLAAARGAGVP